MGGNEFEKNGPCSLENGPKISKKKAKWPKITFRGPILVPEVAFWGFGGYQIWHFGCPNQNSETTFQYKLAPKTPKKPPQEPKSALEK